jgi:hypothetical protein
MTRAQDVFARRLRTQALGCSALGSPLYADLMERAALDVEAGGPVLDVLAGHENDPGKYAVSLRLFGGLHRLALMGRAGALARHLPSTGGDGDPDGAWSAMLAVLRDEAEWLRHGLLTPPQTNEVGRSAALLVGFHTVGLETGLPLRVLEVGSSAGLNLRWDQYRYEPAGGAIGDPLSPVQFPSSWFEGAWTLPAEVTVAERRGCDADPIDVTSEDDRLRLLSYVWPDQLDRFERLAGALDVAQRVPITIETADACEWLDACLADPVDGVATVVFHSIFIQYLSDGQRDRLHTTIADAGGRASAAAPVAWLRMESAGDHAEVQLTSWPGGTERLLATAGYHGQPVRWLS